MGSSNADVDEEKMSSNKVSPVVEENKDQEDLTQTGFVE